MDGGNDSDASSSSLKHAGPSNASTDSLWKPPVHGRDIVDMPKRNYRRLRNFINDELEYRRAVVGGIDALWLITVDAHPDFSPTCASSFTLEGKLTREKTIELVEELSHLFPRYAEHMVDRGDQLHGARFAPMKHFKVEDHSARTRLALAQSDFSVGTVRTIRLPEPAGKAELDDATGKFIAEPWDLCVHSLPLRRPLTLPQRAATMGSDSRRKVPTGSPDSLRFALTRAHSYRDDRGAQSALIMRGHHLNADGKGYVLSQLSITSYRRECVAPSQIGNCA
jgi:hypothetical protein